MVYLILWASGGIGIRVRLKIECPKDVRVQVPPRPPRKIMISLFV